MAVVNDTTNTVGLAIAKLRASISPMPCPWCRVSPLVYVLSSCSPGHLRQWQVYCDNHECPVRPRLRLRFRTVIDSVSAWNEFMGVGGK